MALLLQGPAPWSIVSNQPVWLKGRTPPRQLTPTLHSARLTPPPGLFSLRSMSIETLGEAWRLGWRVTARCAFGNRDGMKSIRECIYRAELDMQTLVWTRGPNFPLSGLESRLMCPECASRRVSLLFDVPKVPVAARAKRLTER